MLEVIGYKACEWRDNVCLPGNVRVSRFDGRVAVHQYQPEGWVPCACTKEALDIIMFSLSGKRWWGTVSAVTGDRCFRVEVEVRSCEVACRWFAANDVGEWLLSDESLVPVETRCDLLACVEAEVSRSCRG